MDDGIYQSALFCSYSQNDPNCSICVRDADLGTVLMTYRGSFVHLILVGKNYIIGAEEFKPIIYVWALNKKDPKLRIACKGVILAMVLSSSQNYLLAAIEEKIYIWMLPGGCLNLILSNHITQITCLKFSLEGPTFISADEHGYIAVWSLPKLLSQPLQYTFTPSLQFTRHSSKITCVILTKLFAISASNDSTIKIWDSITGDIQQDILLDVPCSSLTINGNGFEIFAGFMDGHIKKIFKNGHISDDFKILTSSSVICLDVSNNGNLIATSVNEIKIFEIETGLCKKILQFKNKLSCTVVKELEKGWSESNHSKLLIEFPVLKFELAPKEERQFVTVNLEYKKKLWEHDDISSEIRNLKSLDPCETSSSSADIWTTKALNKTLYNFMIERILNK